ncbi:hypothetical protein [Brevundimonas sp.]|jgi:hypothetical protein|uniref:hypothetical protein n=1 Tax=Brevundimonas sp. TaxID=1871086 RepID=UPI003782FC89
MKINLPTSWEAVNLKQFAQLQAKLQDGTEDVIERYLDIITVLSGEKPSIVNQMPLEALKKAIDYVSFINHLPKETKIKNQFEINGQIYKGVIDVTKLTAGQYIDIKTFCKNTDEIFDNLANIMAVIYIEEGQEYEGTKHAHRARIFQEHLKISEVYGFTLFFSNLLNDLTADILDFTIREQRVLIEEMQRDLMSNGDGLGY